MWIVTDKGFFSFVVDNKDPNYLWLRARVREDLARNFPDVEILEKPGSDYVFRAKVLRTEVAARMSQMIMDADIKSHFKDVAKQRSAKPTHGDRGRAYYAFWNAMAELQPYAPYSKTPRPVQKPWTPPTRQGAGAGQGSLFSNPTWSGTYTRPSGGGTRAADFDWATRTWQGGDSAPDPRPAAADANAVDPEVMAELLEELGDATTDEDFELVWATMTDEEREAYLDIKEEEQRVRESIEEDFGAAARQLDLRQGADGFVRMEKDAYPAPRLTRKQKRAQRRQRENDPVRAQRNRDGLNGEEARNRQGYLDKQAKAKGRKGR